MIEQCKFRNGENNFQCNPVKGLRVLKEQTGDVFSVGELKQIMCESSSNGDCPAFRSLSNLGRKSEYARLIA